MSAGFSLCVRRLLMPVILAGPAQLFLAQQFAQQSAQQGAPPAPETQRPESGNFLFKSTVNRVVLDVVVTDSQGRPVHGLTQQDFSVAEDGRLQQITSFDVTGREPAAESAKRSSQPLDAVVGAPRSPEHGPLYVLLLDLVNTEADDEIYARQQLLEFISGKPAGTRFAIFVLSDGLHLLQGFTDDRNQLYAVLDPAHPGPHLPRVFLDQRNYGHSDIPMMVSVLTYIGRFLDRVPGRKNLIWLSGEFPLKLFACLSQDSSCPRYVEMTKGALDLMAQNHVALYPVDVRGVAVDNPRAPAPSPEILLASSYLLQDEIAKSTGGRAYHSDNGLKDLLNEAVEDGANYYTLTYSPSNRNYDGALRRIEVSLAKNGYSVSYPSSYRALADKGNVKRQ